MYATSVIILNKKEQWRLLQTLKNWSYLLKGDLANFSLFFNFVIDHSQYKDFMDFQVSASIARPYAKKTRTKYVMRGNFKVEKEEAKIIKSRDENVEKAEVKIIEVSGQKTKRKHRKSKSKSVITQKPKALSPQKTIKKNKTVHKVSNVEMPKEAPHRHAAEKRPNKDASVPVHPQGSRKRPFKEAPDSSRGTSKGKKMKNEKGMRGGPHPHQSENKKSKPFKGSKQHQRGGPSLNKERAPKRSHNDHHGNFALPFVNSLF
jgi:hypothetical protein